MQNNMFIDGKWISRDDRFPVVNPATLEVITNVPDATPTDMVEAVKAAETAFPSWSTTNVKTRSQILLRIAEELRREREALAKLITLEQGKVYRESLGETETAAQFFEWFANEVLRSIGTVIPAWVDTKRLLTIDEPIGVVLAITPWNFPAAMISRKVAPALAAGCTVVVKPAEQTPLTALFMAHLFERIGLPPGVFNVVTTNNPSDVVKAAFSNPALRKVSFTGSNAVGKIIMQHAASNFTGVSLELGGNAPFLVFSDADIDKAVDGAIQCKFRNAGQTCVCTNRTYVHEDIYDVFVDKLVSAVRTLKVGPGSDSQSDIGPIIDSQGYNKIQEHVIDAVNSGATLALGNYLIESNGPYFVDPIILTSVSASMKVIQEETFGPVMPVMKFSSDEEAIALANNTPFGLAAYIFTTNIGRAIRVSEALRYGVIGLNDPIPATPQAPFGGVKASGMGREGGSEGLREFLVTKFISLGI